MFSGTDYDMEPEDRNHQVNHGWMSFPGHKTRCIASHLGHNMFQAQHTSASMFYFILIGSGCIRLHPFVSSVLLGRVVAVTSLICSVQLKPVCLGVQSVCHPNGCFFDAESPAFRPDAPRPGPAWAGLVRRWPPRSPASHAPGL